MKAKMLQCMLSKPQQDINLNGSKWHVLHYVGQGGWTEQGTRDLHDKI